MAGLSDIRNRAWRAVRGAQDTYRVLGRFQRMRVLIVGLLVVDIVATVSFVFIFSGPYQGLEVSYRGEYPTNMLVIRNRTNLMTEARVVLDETYQFKVSRLEVGPLGIEIRDFRDPNGLPPDASYVPRRAAIVTADDRLELVVGHDPPP